jgi:hypothetical protein
MRKTLSILILASITIALSSCNSINYIHHSPSKKRQLELKKMRSKNTFGNIGLAVGSMVLSSAVDIEMDVFPDREFKKLKLLNKSNDTLYVNMLTDIYWDEQNYCDFYDLRIPPHKKSKLLVPVDANYNLYFSNTSIDTDDELLEINTNDFYKIVLYPGLISNFENELPKSK